MATPVRVARQCCLAPASIRLSRTRVAVLAYGGLDRDGTVRIDRVRRARHDPDELAADRGRQTPQVPPKPTVTWLPSTITGTARRPLLNSSIRWSSAGFFFTLMYSNATCRRR